MEILIKQIENSWDTKKSCRFSQQQYTDEKYMKELECHKTL